MPDTIPDDFPHCRDDGAIPGAVPKYLARQTREGKFVVGLTQEELWRRYQQCCTLATGMTSYCENKLRENPSWSSQFLMDRTGLKIASEAWGYTDDEITWVLKRIATELSLEWEPGHWRRLNMLGAINGLAQYSAS